MFPVDHPDRVEESSKERRNADLDAELDKDAPNDCSVTSDREAAGRPAARARARARLDGAHERIPASARARDVSHTYPSRKHSLSYLATALTEMIVERAGDRPLHAVTHSMGGVVVRHLHDPRLHWQRIVMLAPPNQGSQIAAGLATNPVFRWFYGPAGAELADASRWPAPPAPFAVIAGTRDRASRT